MLPRARIYFDCVVGTGLLLLLAGLTEFAPANPQRFCSYLAVALLGATWRVRMAGIPVTLSPVFGFVLIGMADYSRGEALLLACGATLVQCAWKPPVRRSVRKCWFNIAVVAMGVMVSYTPPHFAWSQGLRNAPWMMFVAAAEFFLVNTGLVAGMIALLEERHFGMVWSQLIRYASPYYMLNTCTAIVVVLANRIWGWGAGLLVVPALYLCYYCYRLYLRHRGLAVV